jgi:hypothetical protein
LAGSNEKAYETNEVSWWSNWTKVKWLDKNAYLLFSDEFDEYFFNRGGFLEITPASRDLVEPMEREFRVRKRRPHILVQSNQLNSGLLSTLASRGYKIADQMAVMTVGDASWKVNQDLKIERVVKPDDWARVYLESFYGESGQVNAVMAVVRRLASLKEADLLLGTLDGRPAGTAALFRTGKVCGVYCVGTLTDMRKRYVASTMLEFCHRTAVKEGRRLVLQTILSDSTEGLYLKLGFKRAYLKDLFLKDEESTP